MRIVVTDAPEPAEVALIERGLVAFNVARALPYDRRPLCALVRDPEGATRGGATGDTDGGRLFLDCLWLPEAARGSGLGGRVLRAAEDEARRRGCRQIGMCKDL